VTETDTGLQYRSRTVVLALGMRGTPRRLGVEGEVPERVAYLLIDAAEIRDRDILVVGGGNAAIEAALDLAEPGLGNRVTVSYKRAVLTSITAENAKRVDEAVAHKLFDLVTASNLIEIHEDNIVLDTAAGRRVINNQMIFAMIGAELPMGFLRGVGIKLARKGGI
jgi:thioredoxin reductase